MKPSDIETEATENPLWRPTMMMFQKFQPNGVKDRLDDF